MTLFDYAVLTIIGVSVLLSVIRGFVREVLALASWIIAFFTASLLSGKVADWLAGTITNDDASSTPVTFEKRVAASADDVEQFVSGSVYTSSSDLELTDDKWNPDRKVSTDRPHGQTRCWSHPHRRSCS